MEPMVEGIVFREATAADAEAVGDVFLESRKQIQSYAPGRYTDDEVRAWIRDIVIPDSEVTVAMRDGRIVGMMSLVQHDDHGWIDHLYLHPDFVNEGIGSRMVAMAKTRLTPPIRLATFQANEGARRFYERHGFVAVDFSDGSRNEENCPDVIYEWRG